MQRSKESCFERALGIRLVGTTQWTTVLMGLPNGDCSHEMDATITAAPTTTTAVTPTIITALVTNNSHYE